MVHIIKPPGVCKSRMTRERHASKPHPVQSQNSRSPPHLRSCRGQVRIPTIKRPSSRNVIPACSLYENNGLRPMSEREGNPPPSFRQSYHESRAPWVIARMRRHGETKWTLICVKRCKVMKPLVPSSQREIAPTRIPPPFRLPLSGDSVRLQVLSAIPRCDLQKHPFPPARDAPWQGPRARRASQAGSCPSS